jgi:hypothetical protein
MLVNSLSFKTTLKTPGAIDLFNSKLAVGSVTGSVGAVLPPQLIKVASIETDNAHTISKDWTLALVFNKNVASNLSIS